MANLGCLWQGFWCFQQTQTVFTNNRWCRHEDPGKLCGHDVRQIQHSWWCLWCKAGHVCLEAEAIWSHPSYPSCCTPACKVCCLSSRMHMGSTNTLSTRSTKSCRLGMDQERWSGLLQRVAKNWPGVDANLNALEGANATALVLLAQHCVAADVKIRLHFNPEQRLVNYTCLLHGSS